MNRNEFIISILAKRSAMALVAIALLSGCNSFLDITKKNAIQTDPNIRSKGTKIDDRRIQRIVKHNITKAHADIADAHVEVNSFNYVVLITGQVPSGSARKTATATAKKVANVRQVHNELKVGESSRWLSRVNDRLLYTKIAYRLSKEPVLDKIDLDIIVENGVVYLRGLVNKEQADAAGHAAQLTKGVKKVVRIFEYFDN